MIKKLIKNKFRVLIAIGTLLALVAVRAFEQKLFYDPFLPFFKTEFQGKSLPDYEGFKLFLNTFLRYFLNTIFSILLIYQIFKEKKLVVFVSWLYLFLFVVLAAMYFGMLYFETSDYLVLFYVRRFLIQPLFLVLFIPAFYYQRKSK
ncbi:exosortase F system-associated membrane protein [Flavobacterium tibetense]|jgi:exosortase F-associated protein|uniref:Exosortase F system-associated protein n=1 Tax=Flavobacterium tibetense TaxID=2233533 RepID=A0A365P4I9_9FLAO|nr:exosortase F system-associated protein [Flavobacterium tibetense]RBA29469.1 exosortase F system-associated protein [Flavobacterium tibetense]